MMRYGSICSGIEAATTAWHPLGWQPQFFSEIEAAPRAVLTHHWPEVPLHGDFTTIEGGTYGAIDLLVGGTPCQSFSVAGLRGGLADDRGNLALQYLRLAGRLRPRWVVWENVPGVFSSLSHAAPDPCPPPPPVDLGCDGTTMETEDEYGAEELHAFNCFLAGLSELGYGFAYRVLDAQYVRVDGFGRAVPQRRRRVFVVGYLGDWRRPAAVLLERACLRGDPAPRREAGAGSAVGAALSVAMRGRDGGAACELGDDVGHTLRASTGGGDKPHAMIAAAFAPAISASNPYGDHESREGLLVAHSLRGEGFDASEDGTGRGTPIVPVAYGGNDTRGPISVATAVNAHGGPHGRLDFESETFIAGPIPILESGKRTGASSASLKAGDGLGEPGDPMFTLGADSRHAIAFDTRQITSATNRCNPQAGDPCHPLAAGAHAPCIAFNSRQDPDVTWDRSGSLGSSSPQAEAVAYGIRPDASREGSAKTPSADAEGRIRLRDPGLGIYAGLAPTLDAGQPHTVATSWAVRRLTPTECERLMGFPDGYTAVPWRGGIMPDGPRHKMLGNSMAVNAMRWIGRRIEAVEKLAPADPLDIGAAG